MERGKLISLEGMDGIGKTTCAKLLVQGLHTETDKYVFLNRKQILTEDAYVQSHLEHLSEIMWNGGTTFSMAPDIPFNGFSKEHWLYLTLAWYTAFEKHMICPFLDAGISVVTDGYVHKEMAKAISSSGYEKINNYFSDILKPDIVIYLIDTPENCMREHADQNRIESGTFGDINSDFVSHQTKLMDIYEYFYKNELWLKVHRKATPQLTVDVIIDLLTQKDFQI